jgi:ribosomal protein S17E
MNENSVETKDIIAAKHGIEKTGVDIHTVYIENIEEAFEENEKLVDENVEDATKHGVEKTGVEIVWMLRT